MNQQSARIDLALKALEKEISPETFSNISSNFEGDFHSLSCTLPSTPEQWRDIANKLDLKADVTYDTARILTTLNGTQLHYVSPEPHVLHRLATSVAGGIGMGIVSTFIIGGSMLILTKGAYLPLSGLIGNVVGAGIVAGIATSIGLGIYFGWKLPGEDADLWNKKLNISSMESWSMAKKINDSMYDLVKKFNLSKSDRSQVLNAYARKLYKVFYDLLEWSSSARTNSGS